MAESTKRCRGNLALDQTRPGDRDIQHDGEVVLTIAPSVEEAMGDGVIDYDLEKERLILVAAPQS
jgi:hypothetical protein